jgi:hypothetical protein
VRKLLALIWRGWTTFAHALGVVNTKILLTISYFVIIALVSVVGRVFGADLLDKRLKKKPSYWHKRDPIDVSLEGCRRQF